MCVVCEVCYVHCDAHLVDVNRLEIWRYGICCMGVFTASSWQIAALHQL